MAYTGKAGRDNRGRFLVGNPGGPGRPRRAVESEYLGVLSEVVPLDVWRKVVERARDDALGGDARARAWLSGLVLGRVPMGLSELAFLDALGVTAGDRVHAQALRVLDPELRDPILGPLGVVGPSDVELAYQVAQARAAQAEGGREVPK